MPVASENYSIGVPAEIGKVERELKKLWEQSAGAMTRACLINLAVYSETPGSLKKNTQLMSQITQEHACRAIVIEADQTGTENRAEAWINAHCHISRTGSKQICSEQLSFRLSGHSTNLLASIVFAHLDSDLPFYLWWQEEFRERLDLQLWAWVDRVVYDSQHWRDFDGQMHLIGAIQSENPQIVLCDLNWTRLDKIRIALAQFFDHPASHHHFAKVDSLDISFAPAHRSTAVLLAGWLAAQLQWEIDQASGNPIGFLAPNQQRVRVTLREQPGEPISEVHLQCGPTKFSIRHPQGTDFLEISRSDAGQDRATQLMPAGSNELVRLMSDELMRGGPHAVYCRAVKPTRRFL